MGVVGGGDEHRPASFGDTELSARLGEHILHVGEDVGDVEG